MPLWDSPRSARQSLNGPGVHSTRAVFDSVAAPCVAALLSHQARSAKERPMKISIPQTKPRNPLVAAAHQRQAGAHRRSNGAQRQCVALALRCELQHERQL